MKLFEPRYLFALTVLLADITHSAEALPQQTLLFNSNRTGNYEIFRANTDGTGELRLTRDSNHDSWWPKPSPDRRKILFVRAPKGKHDDYAHASTWVMNADGSEARAILPHRANGWKLQAHPEWSPDGKQIALVAGPTSNPQIFIVDADGTNPVRLTSNGRGGNRPGTNIDPSWKPDGEYLLFVGCPRAWCLRGSYEIYRIRRDGTDETRLTFNDRPDFDPYYSPDTRGFPGSGNIAWLENTGGITHWSIRLMNTDGSSIRTVIDDGGINSKPAWSIDSSHIYFHRLPPKTPGLFNVWRIRRDGRDLRELILPRPAYVNEYPVNALN
ncbi:TolB protein [Povalibacter uvarum]|uniref:TolB protein n=1 Tax=Povalibacter uvarum TaxID=732238 RepID=A0A841HQX1_9GAMM|nr:PD40 domain-containing protein [Povalibacter uvarum]MBB6094432.1 TolB protein [Povalibacter uvarum]